MECRPTLSSTITKEWEYLVKWQICTSLTIFLQLMHLIESVIVLYVMFSIIRNLEHILNH